MNKVDEVLNSPRLLNLPLLLLANKQDSPSSLSVAEIRESFDAWNRARPARTEKSRDKGKGKSKELDPSPEVDGAKKSSDWDDGGAKDERMASLDVMGVSGLEGSACGMYGIQQADKHRTGVRDAVNWLYIRVQNARKMSVTQHKRDALIGCSDDRF